MRILLVAALFCVAASFATVKNCTKVANAEKAALEILKENGLSEVKAHATVVSAEATLNSFFVFGAIKKIAYSTNYDITKPEVLALFQEQANFLAALKERGAQDSFNCVYDGTHGYTVSVLEKELPPFVDMAAWEMQAHMVNMANARFRELENERQRLVSIKSSHLAQFQGKKLLVETLDYFRSFLKTYMAGKKGLSEKDTTALNKMLAGIDGYYAEVTGKDMTPSVFKDFFEIIYKADVDYPAIDTLGVDPSDEPLSPPATPAAATPAPAARSSALLAKSSKPSKRLLRQDNFRLIME